MAFSKVVTSTYSLAKELSTVFFIKAAKIMVNATFVQRIINTPFIQRNRLPAFLGSLLWVAVIILGYIIYDKNCNKFLMNLYGEGATISKEFASSSSIHLLENDILSMNTSIRDLSRGKTIDFVAITDHRNIVVAHTNSEMIDLAFKDLTEKELLESLDGVIISSGKSSDGNDVILFSREIFFSNISIGKFYYAVPKSLADTVLRKYWLVFISGTVALTFLISLILLIADKFARAKNVKLTDQLKGVEQIGPYILRKKIGQGGMAEVFLADYVGEDGFRKRVALKKVLPYLMEYPEFSRMFIREARLAALLQHPNIVQVMDFRKIDNTDFIAMEYIHGKTLRQLMVKVQGKLPMDVCIFIVLKVSSALYCAHSRKNDISGEPLNIIHRDISPQNVLLSYRGEVKLTDFGISKSQSEKNLTQPGVIKGKISYMAPEQLLGKPLTQQADIYSLGVIFYEMLTGCKLNKFETYTEAIDKMRKWDIAHIEKIGEEFPDELNRIVMKCLEAQPDLRFPNAQMLNNDLELLKKQHHIIFDESNLAAFLKKHFQEEAVFD